MVLRRRLRCLPLRGCARFDGARGRPRNRGVFFRFDLGLNRAVACHNHLSLDQKPTGDVDTMLSQRRMASPLDPPVIEDARVQLYTVPYRTLGLFSRLISVRRAKGLPLCLVQYGARFHWLRAVDTSVAFLIALRGAWIGLSSALCTVLGDKICVSALAFAAMIAACA